MTRYPTADEVLDAHPGITVLSLDFFDTLVTRFVAQPTHVFAEVERRLVPEFGPHWMGFARTRVQVEHELRVALAASGSPRDVTHEEIFDAVRTGTGATQEQTEFARETERRIEVEWARAVPFGRDLAGAAIRRGLRIIIVSDNYMPALHLMRMAHAAGLDWVEPGQIWVSCEQGGTKQNGALWRTVLAQTGVAPKEILHVGDHETPDGTVPSAMGVRCHLDPRSSCWHRHPMNTCPAVLPFSRIEASQRDTAYAQDRGVMWNLGSSLVAMIAAGQVKDMVSVVDEREIAGVHFAARDGWIAHNVWADYRSGVRPDLPEATYLSFSRSVIGRANITKVDDEVAVRFVDEHERLTTRRLSQRFACDIESSLSPDTEMGSADARALLVRNSDRIVAASAALRRRVVGHLAANGLLTKGHHLVADLGWRASTMADLADIVGEATDGDATVEGRFVGLYWDATMNRLRLPVHGYAMDDLGPLDDNIRLLGAVRLFELLVSAPHGSVVDFLDEDAGYAPVHSPAHDAVPAEQGTRVAVAIAAATSAARQILLGSHPSGVNIDDITPASVWAAMMQVAHTPRADELDELSRFVHVASVDHADGGIALVAPPPRWASTVPLQWYAGIYDDTMKTRWFQGSLRSWERTPAARGFAEGVMRLWPFMGPVWCDPS